MSSSFGPSIAFAAMMTWRALNQVSLRSGLRISMPVTRPSVPASTRTATDSERMCAPAASAFRK
jgi:hypothetical protein